MDNLGYDLKSSITGLSYRNLLSAPSELQERVREWRNKDHVRGNMLTSEIISSEEHGRWLAFLENNPHRQTVRIAFTEGKPFGILTLKDMDEYSSRSDWGMYIGEPDYLGHGYARSMLFDLMTWAFEEKKLSRLFTSVIGDNVRALQLYQECGFHREGCFENHIRRENGDLVDLIWLAYFRSEWAGKKSSFKERLEKKA